MSFDHQEAARAYHRDPDAYKKRNEQIRSMASQWGGGKRAAEKFGITRQRVSQIAEGRK